MSFPCQLVGKQGESVTLEASNGGLFVTVIPSAASIDDAVLDVFGLGIRFTNLTMAVAALRKKQDFKAAETELRPTISAYGTVRWSIGSWGRQCQVLIRRVRVVAIKGN